MYSDSAGRPHAIAVSRYRHVVRTLAAAALLGATAAVCRAEAPEVGITAGIAVVEVIHEGRPIRIQRIQDTENMVDFQFALTSRPCPPFCIQPMRLAPGVDTIGELELLDYLVQAGRDDTAPLVIDSREPWWLENGMIPGAVNIPWQQLHPTGATPRSMAELLEFRFGAARQEELWDFSNARTLIFYCNGPWCGQSPTSIRALLNLGYPPTRLKWYRGGMQSWSNLGLTTVAGADTAEAED